ncbi:ATP-binding protein [Lentilactobacillus sp. SPB1-3]|uniref:ATP-binding protein n=1 Tax=Lentilactobacillus terminaliae TaxID=3003483 RepID=A0ACD5DDL2_9LACO|nr:ATP-binding protein [Lentilactobacillus sp. SPB1-3]MCZ0978010.1 ATP-binding protein [Lentilactobacillus sp. SPB1-3]
MTQTIAEAINDLFVNYKAKGLMRDCGPCPMCQQPMMVFVNTQTGDDRSLPACPSCGYKESNGTKQHHEDLSVNALKNDAYNYLVNSSAIGDTDVLNKKFSNYQVVNDKQAQAKALAERIADKAASGDVVHGIFSGATGTGKSHLSMAIVYQVLEATHYKQKIAFIDIRELITQIKRGFKDQNIARHYDRVLDKAKQADLVIIDDLGSETTGTNSGDEASRFNLEIVTELLQARMNKSTVISTNLTSNDLINIYGERIVSRMMAHSQGYVMKFDELADYRIKGAV